MRHHSKLVRVAMLALGFAVALPIALTVVSNIAHADSGYIFVGGEAGDPGPDGGQPGR